MEKEFTPVADAGALEELFERSRREPVLIFKHSTACPISAAAHGQMRQLGREVPIVVVQQSRDLSREVETRTGVRHESPQALVIRDGQVVWSATHFDVTADAVRRALEEAGGKG
ncbi:MAG TPA: bacillithiol system redox-active protein YtxJ [Pyrinomonadaceae bacterium]|nr:bacillithiol system redox-active protein YtxJ [Pyrinomonadaceae bacterium]